MSIQLTPILLDSIGFRYFLNPPQNLIAQLDFVSVHCIDVVTFPDTVPEFAYTFQITLVDETLETIPDSVQRQRHIDLNIIEPHTLNITIVDDDGEYIASVLTPLKSLYILYYPAIRA